MELYDIEEDTTAIDINNIRTPINIEFQNICYRNVSKKGATDRRFILNNVSGAFYSGRLTAVIGTKNSGKSTLLHFLSGLKTDYAATNIKLNGQISNNNHIRATSSYVTHETTLLDHLTTFETLKFAANFKINQNTPNTVKLKLINRIIDELNLTDCRNLSISKLNKSQRNVLALGIGLITKSAVIYFDLKIQDFENKTLTMVLDYLRNMVGHGRTIVCALDQPTTKILQMFDDVMLLANGKSLYCGPYNKMVDEFSKVGFVCPPCLGYAEFILDIALQSEENENTNELLRLDGTNQNQNTLSLDSIRGVPLEMYQSWSYPNGYWYQFVILMQRSIIHMIRDFMYVQLRLITNIIIGIFIGLLYFGIGNYAEKMYTNTSMLFFMMLFVFFGNVFPNVLSIPMDITIFLEEHKHRHYSMKVFFIVKILTEIIQHIIGPTIFLVISFFMTDQPTDSFVYLWIIIMMTSILSLGYSLVIVTIAPNTTVRIYTILIISIPMLLFSGMFIKRNELSPYFEPAIYISIFRYAFEGLMQSIYGFKRPTLICSEDFCYFKIPQRYLEVMFMGGDVYWYDVGGLAIWILVTFVLFYMALRYRVARRK